MWTWCVVVGGGGGRTFLSDGDCQLGMLCGHHCLVQWIKGSRAHIYGGSLVVRQCSWRAMALVWRFRGPTEGPVTTGYSMARR